ncbi:MAG: hypothetical protein K9K66_08505 [Desulfarculaceae bacterium]|nr:hypothetical protein [Desulfarculaceae bacterium]MCF8071361.1 hypothetical protein [Desulfarculaceae bacterium]MCF8101686.1 hypothetical protein [Desulfarculaceae bacterium]MCF8116705.1 hypothetical protein [Desulfarculaceae bacterium]
MDNQTIDALQERARRLRQDLEALSQQAGDFPAVVRNAERIRASLAMICLDLGLDAQGNRPEEPPAA